MSRMIKTEIHHSAIAKRAYEIYLRRQEAAGDALSDWINAENELKNELALALSNDSTSSQKTPVVAKSVRTGKSSKSKGTRHSSREAVM